MKIQINEVWNQTGKSEELTVIEVNGTPSDCRSAVRDWIDNNRPDLQLASGLYDHGYHARGLNN